jgi:SprT protein
VPNRSAVHPGLVELAESLLDDLGQRLPLGYRPTLRWRRLRVSAGLAHFREGAISLSVEILTTKERLADTLLHEYAHLLAFARHGAAGKGHGPAWRQAMADVGLPAVVRHRYEVRRNSRRQVVLYACARCGVQIERSRRFARGRLYRHVDCGGAIVLVRVQGRDALECA